MNKCAAFNLGLVIGTIISSAAWLYDLDRKNQIEKDDSLCGLYRDNIRIIEMWANGKIMIADESVSPDEVSCMKMKVDPFNGAGWFQYGRIPKQLSQPSAP